ncbi:MAG: hypothetical protein ACI8QZ_000912 [Chlamydiales bacterium]|jgi:hypothetical protein
MIEDILKGVLGEKEAAWVEMLTSQFDFSIEQAQAFVPIAIDKLVGLVGTGSLDLSTGVDPETVLAKLDMTALATESGIDADKALSGMQGMLADVVSSFGEQMASMSNLLSQLGGDGDDALSKLGDMFGK